MAHAGPFPQISACRSRAFAQCPLVACPCDHGVETVRLDRGWRVVNAPSPGSWVPQFVELKRDRPDAVRFPANVDRSTVDVDRAGNGGVGVCRHRAMLSRVLGRPASRTRTGTTGLGRGCEASSEPRVTPTQSLKSSCAPQLFNGVRRLLVAADRSGRAPAYDFCRKER